MKLISNKIIINKKNTNNQKGGFMYNKQKCQSCIRRVVILNTGLVPVKIIVTGKHAHSWSVILIRLGVEKSLSFPSRIETLRELQNLKTQYRLVGDCKLTI